MTYFRVSASVLNWYFIIGVMIWRQVLKSNRVQRYLHRPMDGKLAVFFQWYSVFFVGVLCMMVYSIFELIGTYMSVGGDEVEHLVHDMYVYNVEKWPSQLVEKFGVESIDEVTFEVFKQPLKIDIYLRVFSIMSSIIGIPVVLVAKYHTLRLVWKGAEIAKQNAVWSEFPFKPTRRLDWVLLVITMPAIYSQASMRATNRMWALMVGKAEAHKRLPWPQVATLEHALYTNDLEIAALFQFATVYCFTRLCSSYLTENYLYEGLSKPDLGGHGESDGEEAFSDRRWLRNSQSAIGHEPSSMETDLKMLAAEFKRVIRRAAFLGVWAFISLGLLRCFCAILLAEMQQAPDWSYVVEQAQEGLMESLSTVFTVFTVLCVINMMIICNLKMIKAKLDAEGELRKVENANSKFLGTRMLLLLAEVQPKIIAAFTVGSDLYAQAKRYKEKVPLIGRWRFSYEQAMLLHSCVLNIECLVVVVWNLVTWYHLDMAKARLMKFTYKPGLLTKLYDQAYDREDNRSGGDKVEPNDRKEMIEGDKHWWKEFLHF